MKEIERHLDRVCGGVAGSKGLRRHLREELREHLEEAVERHAADGLPPEEAARRAIEEFGEADIVGEELQGIYGRRLVSLLIEKAMAWKEDTMKTEWKWSFVAHLALFMTVVVGATLVLSIETYIFPLLLKKYEDIEITVPSFVAKTWGVFIALTQWWYAWIPPIILGLILFELRYRQEQKPIVRLAGGGIAALVSMAAAFLAAATTLVPLGMMPVTGPMPVLERLAMEHATEANASYARLKQAAEQDDLKEVANASRDLRRSLYKLGRQDIAAYLLATLGRKDTVESIRELLDEVADASYTVSKQREIAENVPRLQKAFERLVAEVEGWPKVE